MAMKAYPWNFLTIFAAVALILHQVDAVDDGDPWSRGKESVVIENELPDVLAVRCYSKDDNLGLHYIQPRGTLYFFSFKSNFWGSTLYWCTFNHGMFSPGTLWNSFPVWTDHGFLGTKKRPRSQCVWIARIDAFYRAPAGGLPIAVQPWRNDTQRWSCRTLHTQ